MVLGPVTQDLIDQVLSEIKKEENQNKIKDSLVDPLIGYLHSKVFTYLQFLGLLMGLMILLLIVLVCLSIKQRS